ncbi:SUMO-interacting motif-containing protein 1 isoform X1 [Tympanuchus pallidicinctus]|uniref:SUMO-interacting motif-containing protein 1 isoform X1 n=1 Tax=Tympanuchus pallidicinctus TaxID=109042 RepID=UPI0022876916|nr:SUMO-interacting motif-containing protein 1 isoform X1 [Tympanuchus pallidicinctus]
MSDGAVLVCDSDSEGGRSPPPPPAEIIDLTQEDTNSEPLPWNYIPIIDLTKEDTCSPPPAADCTVQDQVSASPIVHTSHPQLCFSTKQEVETSPELTPVAPLHGYPTQPSTATGTAVKVENKSSFSPVSSHRSSFCSLEPSCSTTTYNTDSSSLAIMQLDQVLFSPSPFILDSNGSKHGIEETPPTSQPRKLPPRLSPAPASITKSPRRTNGTFLEAGGSQEAIQQVTSGRTKADSMVWLNKLRYFRRSGVQHLFFYGAASDRETPQQKPKLIPSSKMSMVRTTMEENFLEGTLHFLSDFISCQHCPPKEIVSHLLRQILLNSQQEEILQNTYTLLMKIQMLHPANTTTVGWDWTLLKYTMESQEKLPGRLLFLQYVVQTLEDDFHQNVRLLQKSISKKVLSCDTCFNNVKEVVEWLVAVVTGARFFQLQEQTQEVTRSPAGAERRSPAAQPASTDQAQLTPPTFFAQKTMLLLQRMLSFAVEVDRSPNCSSCKIADLIFPFLLNIPTRSQREALLNTMESNLLRCKLLEMMFQHSCDVPTSLPLSLSKILYFLGHSSVLLQYQDEVPTWQKWDELLHYLSLLLLSYQNVIAEHLRSSLSERVDLIIKKAKPKLQDDDDISQLDIHLKIKDFLRRMQQILEEPFPVQLKEKVSMLKKLFLTVAAT